MLIKTNKAPSEPLIRTAFKIITSAYIISKLDYCNAALLSDITKLQVKIFNNIIKQTCRLIC